MNGSTTTFANGTPKTVPGPTNCAVWSVTNGGSLAIQSGGGIGNAFMDIGTLSVQDGGVVTGFAEAGGYYRPSDSTVDGPSAQGVIGTINIYGGGQLGTALIGPQSTLNSLGTDDNNRARVGSIETDGTVTLSHTLVDPNLAVYTAGAALAIDGGQVTINDSEIRGGNGAGNAIRIMGQRTEANTTATVNITNSKIDQVPDADAIALLDRGGYLDYNLTLTNTDVTSAPSNALYIGQTAPPVTNDGHGAINVSISGGTYTGGNAGIAADVWGTKPVDITLTNGVHVLAPNTGAGDIGNAMLLTGTANVTATDSVLEGASHGLKIGSARNALGGPTVALADTQVTGTNGSAIYITRGNQDAVTHSTITIGAGTTLSGGDGNILTTDNGALADFTVDGNAGTRNGAVNLVGNIAASGAGTGLNVQLKTNATINGNIVASAGSGVTLVGDTASSHLNGAVTAAASTANVNLSNGAKVTGGVALSDRSTGQIALTGNGSALSNGNGAAISVNDSTATIALNSGATLAGKDNLLVDVRNAGQADVTLDNTVQTGDMMRAADSTLNVKLQNNTQYTGNVKANSMTVSSGSSWLMDNPQATDIGGLTLNTGLVDFNAGNGPFKTLKTSSLDGSGGRFNMGVDFNPGAGNDLLQVAGKVDNDNRLHVDAKDQSVADPRNHITLVQTGGGNGQFGLVEGEKVDAGIYVYNLQRTGDDWELVQSGTRPDNPKNPNHPDDPDHPDDPNHPNNPDNPDNPNNPDNPGNPDKNPPKNIPDAQHLSPAAKTALNVASALPFEFYGEMDTLRKRQGDLRLNKTDNGAWVRSFSNFNEIREAAAPGYSLNQYGGAFGADKRFELSSGDMYVGGFGSYSYNTVGVDGGSSGRTNSYGLGGYATWLRSDGWYVDSILKANSFENDLRVVGSNGTPAHGHYNTPGYGGSVEVGKHINVGKKSFVEPYGELQGFAAHNANEKLDSGFRIHNGATKSTQGEIGVLGGTNFELGKGYEVQPYLKTAVVREFVDDNSVTLNGTRIKNDMSGNHMLVGTGVVVQLKQDLQAHVDVDYTAGGPIKHTTDVNIGVRYVF
ncbi:autotransporter outer membrane beta-barrel domain-containing protein [Bordetella sp. LUAb4]|uniref:autotransporter outer membrane beta-barrel domain-containing protein n=1 Tax=Bordetella sp. LUAb4 TaxID=2843195 RepID=UPI001E3ED15D|nr:autotransporter outer membrane beta-barrel domain-containing protein [Bordetella sp. LUAb4]